MELTLIKVSRHGENNSAVHFSIEASYGWEGEMHREIIQLNYNGMRRELFVTVKVKNPGTGSIAERIINMLGEINYAARSVKNPPLLIIEKLAEHLTLEYNPADIDKVLKQYPQ